MIRVDGRIGIAEEARRARAKGMGLDETTMRVFAAIAYEPPFNEAFEGAFPPRPATNVAEYYDGRYWREV